MCEGGCDGKIDCDVGCSEGQLTGEIIQRCVDSELCCSGRVRVRSGEYLQGLQGVGGAVLGVGSGEGDEELTGPKSGWGHL